MRKSTGGWVVLFTILLCTPATAQWWVGGESYSLRVNKYNAFYGEARPIVWSCEGIPAYRSAPHFPFLFKRGCRWGSCPVEPRSPVNRPAPEK